MRYARHWLELDSVKHAFKPHHGKYAPVAGGRWFVRRWEDSRTRKDGRVWHAWTAGSAKKFNRRFTTQEEAISWAVRVASAWRSRDWVPIEALKSEMKPNSKDSWVREIYVSGSVALVR